MAPVATTLRSETSDNASVGAIGKTTSGKPLRVRAYPKFDSLEEERLYRKQHLAAAYRVFAERGFDEGVAGHISVRDPILTDHFCKLYVRPDQIVVNFTDVSRQGSTHYPATSPKFASAISSLSTKTAKS
jgi:hypothetical protein